MTDTINIMPKRFFVGIALLALIVAACGGDPNNENSTTTSTTVPEVEAPEAVLLSYELTDGDTFVYEIDLSQTISMTAEGTGGALGADEEVPGDADLQIDARGTITYVVAAGPDPGTYEVTITGDFTEMDASGTVDGEPISEEEVPEFTEMTGAEPFTFTVVVDEQGNIVPQESNEEDPFGGFLGGLEGLGGGELPGTQLGQFFGPAFSEGEVTVGDTWTDTIETPGFGTEPIVTTASSEVAGVEEVGGVEVFVIETNTVTSAFEFDLGQFMIGMFTGFMSEDPSAEEQAEIDNLVENLRFLIASDEATGESVAYFDADAGLTRRMEANSSSVISMDINFPDEETGEMAGFLMRMELANTVSQALVDGPGA